MKKIMNKRGEIALTLALILTFVLILTGLYAMVTDNKNFGYQSRDVAVMLSTLNFDGNYIKSEAGLIVNETLLSGVEDSKLKEKYEQIALNHKLSIESEGTFFTQIKNGDFKFENISNQYIFQINGVILVSKVGNNQITRNINYTLTLNKTPT